MKKKICSCPSCNKLVNINERYCTEHTTNKKPFESAIRFNESLYNTTQWRRLRNKKIKEQPYCSKCGASKLETRLEVHHLIPPKGNEELFFNEDNLLVVCTNCHKVITANEIKGKHYGT
jgi:5-methylcytosine-specific restriction protein A